MRHRRITGVVLVTAGAALGVAALGGAAIPDDDLAVVKKAVASPAAARASQAATPEPERPRAAPQAAPSARPGPREERPLLRSGREPQWFKVRIVEKGTGRKRVTVNLPLSLVRALGDDTIDWDCRGVSAAARSGSRRSSRTWRRDRTSSRSTTTTRRSRSGWSEARCPRAGTRASVPAGGRGGGGGAKPLSHRCRGSWNVDCLGRQ